MNIGDLIAQRQYVGIAGASPVTIIALNELGTDAAEIIWRDRAGTLGSSLVTGRDLGRVKEVDDRDESRFDADAAWYQLGLEARRIADAHRFDPHFAVHASAVEPLPHQITAVYEEMLPRRPLRFLLADDPGAGKTIMAGLLIKELIARGDVQRCLVVAPGSLVDQWVSEMHEKFALDFRIFDPQQVPMGGGNPFRQHDLLVARLDQLSRKEDLHPMLEEASWDLVICDEAHRMSARRNGIAISKTARYRLGELLSDPLRTRHFLLMSATPHNGKRDDFRLLMALLDRDRYLGRLDDPQARFDAGDMMRRLVKERLVRFDGTRLFPRRVATTISYSQNELEQHLYEAVGKYVRTAMGRAERLQDAAEGAQRMRAVQVGFVLQMLQRRVASSPAAIHRSLSRRRDKVAAIYARFLHGMFDADDLVNGEFDEDVLAIVDELEEADGLRVVEGVLDEAFAAESLEELKQELDELTQLEALARAVLESGEDRKWSELEQLLRSESIVREDGTRRKLIVFTEHRDTLDYLERRIAGILGENAVASIHGSMSPRGRRGVQDAFRTSAELSVLVATDAAGEGVNLQSAHLMVNYDLPWNPNRIEQRFGRVHRIGQQHECHLWNLVAHGTREGRVYERLLGKLDQIAKDIGGDGDAVYDVIGELFADVSLEKLLESAVQGDEQAAARSAEKVADLVDLERVRAMLAERALTDEVLDPGRVAQLGSDIRRSDLVRIAPYQLAAFVRGAIEILGGRIAAREPGRWKIERIPDSVLRIAAGRNARHEVARSYERVCFEERHRLLSPRPDAVLIQPGHPLVTSLVEAVLRRTARSIERGCVLVDEFGIGDGMRLLHVVEQDVVEPGDGSRGSNDRVVAQRTWWVEQHVDGRVELYDYARVNDLEAYSRQEVDDVSVDEWKWVRDLDSRASVAAVATQTSASFRDEVVDRELGRLERERSEVEERLRHEIVDFGIRVEQEQLKAETVRTESAKGRNVHQANAERYRQRMLELEQRLVDRQAGFARREMLRLGVPRIRSTAVVIPGGADGASSVEHVTTTVAQQLRELGYSVAQPAGCAWDLEVLDANGSILWFGVVADIWNRTTVSRANALACGGDTVRTIQVIDGNVVVGRVSALPQLPTSGMVTVNIEPAPVERVDSALVGGAA